MFRAQFYRVRRGQPEDIGLPVVLGATNLDSAQDEALGLVPPAEANCVKILADDRVVSRHGFAL